MLNLNILVKALLLSGSAVVLLAAAAFASSDFTNGNFAESDPAATSYHDLGICQLLTGPRAGLSRDEFLMTIGDRHSSDYGELRLTGDFVTVPASGSGERKFRLFPNDKSAAVFFQTVLRRQLSDPSASFTLYALTANVREVRLPVFGVEYDCRALLTGRLNHVGGVADAVSVSFRGNGQYIPAHTDSKRSFATSAGPSVASDPPNPCPSATSSSVVGPNPLAPEGLAPHPGQCNTPNCLIDFKGYKWWTSYVYFPPPTYFFNQGNQFSPKNAFVDSQGLHLVIKNQTTGGPIRPSAAEVVAMFKADGSPANLGYGTYLVTAKVTSATSWDALDPNATFGAFTYERAQTGAPANPKRELDLAEISRWGFASGDPNCRSGVVDPVLCSGNAQFTIQEWNHPNNIHRYSIDSGGNTVTLVMIWRGAGEPVSFKQYNGSHTLEDLKKSSLTPNHQWTTTGGTGADSQNRFIPTTACERFHLNFWMGNYDKRQFTPDGYHPYPKTLPQEVVVTDFEFKAP